MYMPPDLYIPVITPPAIIKLEDTKTASIPQSLPENNTLYVVKKDVIPEEDIRSITIAVDSNNETKINKIINEYSLDALAKLRFDFKTENNITYKNINLFFLACHCGAIKIVQELINNENIDIDEPAFCENGTSGRTPLFITSSTHVEIVKLLLEHNATIDIKDKNGHNAIQFSLAFSDIDTCYKVQDLLQNSKKQLGLTSSCYNLRVNTTFGYSTINFFNNNQDFLITFFYQDNNKNILDLEVRTSNSFIQCFLGNFKSYIIYDSTKPVDNNIIEILEKALKKNNISIEVTQLEEDPNINKGLNIAVYQQQDGQSEVISHKHSINFQDQLVIDNKQANLIDHMLSTTAVYYNKTIAQINKSDLIKVVYAIVTDCVISKFDDMKAEFSECHNLPDNLFDLAGFSEEQQLKLINELTYISVVLSFAAIQSIPDDVVSSWK